MAQPVRKSGPYQKPRSKTVKKSNAPTSPKRKNKPTVSEMIKRNIERSKKNHPKYGTSKLEKRFAKEFLDKLGVKYATQFEAKDIKRFYDFYLPDVRILLEIDGVFWHGKGLLHEEKNYQQKRAEYVDKIKDEWALMHGIPLIRIWEDDINNKPSEVMAMLKEKVGEYGTKYKQELEKKKRH